MSCPDCRPLFNRRWVFAAIGATLLLLYACGELPPRTAHDPANPNAPEAPTVIMPAATMTESPAPMDHSAHGGMTMMMGDASAKVYTCPMHPEVTAPSPGKCPKCGMTLQLKASP